uniref:Uncharacterized protein n=1 Tax=Anguilla anguilla TaxID=7936 RepID=A0A0E9W328_ANGAN
MLGYDTLMTTSVTWLVTS